MLVSKHWVGKILKKQIAVTKNKVSLKNPYWKEWLVEYL